MATTTPTIRERLLQIQSQIINAALSPADVRDNLLLLTALLGNVIDEHRVADHAFHVLVAAHIEAGNSVASAEARARTSQQYVRSREAADAERLTLELIRSSKIFLTSLDNEMKLQR